MSMEPANGEGMRGECVWWGKKVLAVAPSVFSWPPNGMCKPATTAFPAGVAESGLAKVVVELAGKLEKDEAKSLAVLPPPPGVVARCAGLLEVDDVDDEDEAPSRGKLGEDMVCGKGGIGAARSDGPLLPKVSRRAVVVVVPLLLLPVMLLLGEDSGRLAGGGGASPSTDKTRCKKDRVRRETLYRQDRRNDSQEDTLCARL